ncbi:hypothetical protein ACCE15_19235 [Pseudomonas parafulva]|uniref:hypothetical protein n=1 Tax=Pseudomonas parafulva TaxID=157782 RepID=UPI003562D5A4
MKKLIFGFLLAITLVGCSDDTMHTSADKLAAKDLSKNMYFNRLEAEKGCAVAQEAVASLPTSSKSDSAKPTYECQGDNNTFTSFENILDVKDLTVSTILSGFLFLLLVFGSIVTIKNYSTGNKALTANNLGKGLSFVFNVILRHKVGVILGFIGTYAYMIASGFLDEMDEQKLLKEKSSEIPDFSVKTAFAKSIYDYQICVKASDFKDVDDDARIKIIKTDAAYLIEAKYKYCELNGRFAIDKQGIEIAKANNLFDYEAMQEKSIIENLSKLIESTDLVATRTVIAKKSLDIVKLPEILTCENTPVSYTGLSKEDKAEVIWKDLECASRKFVVNMTKFKGMTEENMDTLAELTGTRRVHICEGEFSEQPYLKRKDMIERYRSCIASNCSESTYACSVALSKFNQVNQVNQVDFLTTTTFNIFEDEPDARSAKMFLGTLNADLVFDENPPPFSLEKKYIAAINVSTNANGNIEYKDIQSFLLNMKLLDWEKAALNFSITDFINKQLDPDNGGLYGMQRFLDCSKSYFTIDANKYDCGSFVYESKLFGYTLLAGGKQLALMNKLLSPKENFKKLDKTDPAYTAANAAMKTVGIDRKILALALPFLVDNLGGVIFEDVFQQNYHSIMGQKGEYYAAMSCVMLSPSCADAIDLIANLCMIGYVVFTWVIPLSPLLMVIPIMNSYFGRQLYKTITIVFFYIIKYGSDQIRRDIDKHDMWIYLENVLIKPMAIVIYFVYSNIFFYIIMMFIVQDMELFIGDIFRISSEDGMAGQAIIKIFSVLFINMFYMLCLFIWLKCCDSLDKRDGTVTHSDGRIQNQAEFRKHAQAMKGKGLA